MSGEIGVSVATGEARRPDLPPPAAQKMSPASVLADFAVLLFLGPVVLLCHACRFSTPMSRVHWHPGKVEERTASIRFVSIVRRKVAIVVERKIPKKDWG